jgi:hypothetical protein
MGAETPGKSACRLAPRRRPGVGLAGYGRGELGGKAQPVQQVRQARARVAHLVRAQQPVSHVLRVRVKRRVDLLAQVHQLGAGEQTPVTRLLVGQVLIHA